MKSKLAAVTMAYNEKTKLPRWIAHHARQVGGAEHLFVLDHGSDDGSTSNLGATKIISVPRDPVNGHTQVWRTEFVSEFCSNLLQDYEYVMYCDTDELVIGHPERYSSILDYVSKVENPTYAIGFDVLHDAQNEQNLDERPILEQRRKLQFVASMCKSVIIKQPTRWVPGFHSSSNTPSYGDLLLFHLRYADQMEGFERLALTRSIRRPDDKGAIGDHQKISDETYAQWVRQWCKYPETESSLDLRDELIKSYVESFSFSNQYGRFVFDYSFRSQHLFNPLPLYRKLA